MAQKKNSARKAAPKISRAFRPRDVSRLASKLCDLLIRAEEMTDLIGVHAQYDGRAAYREVSEEADATGIALSALRGEWARLLAKVQARHG